MTNAANHLLSLQTTILQNIRCRKTSLLVRCMNRVNCRTNGLTFYIKWQIILFYYLIIGHFVMIDGHFGLLKIDFCPIEGHFSPVDRHYYPIISHYGLIDNHFGLIMTDLP